ncbi:Glucan endo-1,3-alpha-glucosidase agn1 [Diatrype stigma]|uniref:Glucan endo-1,3-alpha-glucosidase agn1 n=1 Tax=Diatrype stigma TaxID=117547 RepID=A0AAN9V926_9PEZI
MKLKQLLPFLAAALAGRPLAEAKAVFAHFMVGNVAAFAQADWESDISLAQTAGIDGFALNIAAGDTTNDASLALAFSAADAKGFKLFFSFDYAAWGAWDAGRVTDLINTYKGRGSYYKQGSQPLVSTFEGTANSGDWASIRSNTGAFFMPDYSSIGASKAVATGVVDGLFSWEAWPNGATDMTTTGDESYISALAGKPYMMPVSPWFYTNLPGYGKNWVWRGEGLWYDRWQQVMEIQPEFVEIITWNDYGESHYIGPLHENEFGLFTSGYVTSPYSFLMRIVSKIQSLTPRSHSGAPFNYVEGMPHDGWRLFLPYLIQQYKTGSATISNEGLTAWYRLNPNTVCSTGSTTGNDDGHGQVEVAPSAILEDKIFFSALLSSTADVSVSIGGAVQAGTWENKPSGGSGIYFGSVPFNGGTGDVVVTISRNGKTVAQINGAAITTACTQNIENWNAWVGSATAGSGGVTPPATTTPPTTTAAPPATTTTTPPSTPTYGSQVCVGGTGEGNFEGLCDFTCQYGYCPTGVCTCLAYGTQKTLPPATGKAGYPLVNEDGRCGYVGLCSFVYNYGYYPASACGTDPAGAAGC